MKKDPNKIINDNNFELIFNIDSGSKFYFGDLDLNLPVDFDHKNFNSIKKLFKKTKGKPYSINTIDKITVAAAKAKTSGSGLVLAPAIHRL